MKHRSFIEFKGSLGYSSLYRPMQFSCHNTTLKKNIFNKKVEFSGLGEDEPLVGGIKIWQGESTRGTFPSERDE